MTNDQPIKRGRGRPRKVPLVPEVAAVPLAESLAAFVQSHSTVVALDPLPEPPRDPTPNFPAPGDAPVSDPAPLTTAQSIALDRDHDGSPGGSWPVASLTINERRGLIEEFYEAYEMQMEAKRTDTFNRVWSFGHEAVLSKDTMVLRVKRGPVVVERQIPASDARYVDVGAILDEMDAETSR